MSIQHQISSEIYRMADHAVTPDQIKALQAHLVKGVQDGAIPSYVGVPLLSDLNQKMTRIQSAPQQAQSMLQQPPIAQQVVGQAEQGLEALPSGLPAQGMAGGGIVAFAGGGMSDEDYDFNQDDDEDEEDDDSDFLDALVSQNASQFPLMATKSRESASYKETGMPEKSVSHETESVSRPAGDIEKIAADKARAMGANERLVQHVLGKETGGMKDRANALSPAGAQGVMQLMPGTARDLGVKDPFNVEQNIEGGIKYLRQLEGKYKDPKLAAIAYNWGPGNTDKWLASGADMAALPRETQKYVVGLNEGGVVHFDGGGLSDVFNMSSDDVKDWARRKLKMDQARSAFSAPEVAAPAEAVAPTAATTAAGESGALYNIGKNLGKLTRGSLPVAAGAEAVGNFGSYKFQEPNLDTSASGVYNELKKGNYGQAGRNLAMGLPEAGMDVARGIAGLGDYLLPGQPLESGLDRLIKSKFGNEIVTPLDKTTAAPAAGQSNQLPVTPGGTTGQSYKRTQGATADQISQSMAPSTPPLGPVDIGFGADQYSPTDTTQTADASKPTGIEALFQQYGEDAKKQKETNAYLSLLAAGLGMMGGTSPFASANIGQGALQGIKAYESLNQGAGADDRALLNARVAAERSKEIQSYRQAQLEQNKILRESQLGTSEARLRESESNHAANQLEQLRKAYLADALSKRKDAYTDEDKARIEQEVSAQFNQLPEVRKLYKKAYDIDLGRMGQFSLVK